MQDSQRFTRGLEIRREVLESEYVDNNLAGSDEFMMTFQHIVTELAWGLAWDGAALDKKTKSVLSVGILPLLGALKRLRFTRRAHLPQV